MLGFPQKSELRKPLYKKAIFEKLKLNTAQQDEGHDQTGDQVGGNGCDGQRDKADQALAKSALGIADDVRQHNEGAEDQNAVAEGIADRHHRKHLLS